MESADGRFRIHIGNHEMETLLTMCHESDTLETGGLLVGRYNSAHDTAIVTRIWGPPKDSVRKRTSFWRGTKGLQKKLNSAWKTREYYLGEWHYHPRGAGRPSNEDIRQMARIASSPEYNTPEPALIVVCGQDGKVVAHVIPSVGAPIGLTAMT